MLAGSCPKVVYNSWAAAFAVETWAHFAPNDKHSLEEWLFAPFLYNFKSGTLASGKTRMVSQGGQKLPLYCPLASNWKNIPLAMKC